MQAATTTSIGSFNERLVLALIRASDEGIPQSEVVRRSRLSRQTVSIIARRLLAEGLIRPAGRRISGPGKPTTLLRVVAEARLTVGVHLDPAAIAIVVCDLHATPLASSTLAPPSDDPMADIARVADEITRLCTELGARLPSADDCAADDCTADDAATDHGADDAADDGAPDDAEPVPARIVLGIGIAAPAPLDAVTGVVRNPPWLPGWREVPVVAALEEATGLPAMLDKDTNAALTGEIWAGHLPMDETALYLYVGHGLGSAVSANGRVHHGSTTQAGELGHLSLGLSTQMCACGRLGCLNLMVDARRLIDDALARGVEVPGELEILDAVRWLADAAEQGDGGAVEATRRHAEALAATLQILADIHDPHRIIVGGPVWTTLRTVEGPPIRAALAGWAAERDGILQPSQLGDAVGALGAACLFLERELSPAHGTSGRREPAP